ncbi:MAG: hypothetical protein IT370_16930 [Deltaproteobacteria bacterium]|nr:hypothetical protein [Deltaproteobacteria bacterium]
MKTAMPWADFATLLEYPGDALPGALTRLRAACAGGPGAAKLEAFASFITSSDPRAVEELYTQSFDLSAPCCLDLGYQLFGETYKRGVFLVSMVMAARKHDVDPGAELADHLPVVLRLLERLGADPAHDALGLAHEVLLPGLDKMVASFVVHEDGQSSPYRALLEALRGELDAAYPGASPPERANVHLPLFRAGNEEAQP